MEPSATGVREGDEYPQEGGFHAGLLFAIRKYLLSDPERESFLITNMAKCTIGGDLCKRTRSFRWNKCSRFLELEIDRAQEPTTQLISIGKAQISYLNRNRAVRDRKIHYVTHYSPQTRDNFCKYAEQRSDEFVAFCEEASEEFRVYLEHSNATYELRQLSTDSLTSVARLFKWRDEMQQIKRAVP
jgi:hypothetical protein